MISPLKLALLAVAASLSLGATPSLAGERLPVHVGGRVVAEPDGALRFGWPGVYVEGRFQGGSVEVAVDAAQEHLAVSIDGQTRAELIKPGAARLSFTGLGPGAHKVRLDKLTESQSGSARFLGFFAGPDAQALPEVARGRRIEFIGDSYTVGYGVRSTAFACTEAQVHDLTDTSLAFGPVLARRLDADYRIVAFSGRGVVRNYAGLAPGEPLPALYDRLIPGEATPRVAADDAWRPQVIVVGLGTNDFSTPVKPGEAWADQTALRTAYRDGYVAFLNAVAARQPQARFLLIAGDLFADDVAEVVRQIDAVAPGLATPVRITGMAKTGCHGHPSVSDQILMADRLEAAINSLP
ncbi:MAG: lipase [Alphaproteobacteria bacterium]|nr:lipase [Alphaproteobacteria bacterium]